MIVNLMLYAIDFMFYINFMLYAINIYALY